MTWQDTNRAYWDSHKAEYPFHARQTEHITATFTRPEQLRTNRHGDFMRIPFDGYVLWAFTSEPHRTAFLQDFGGEIYDGKDQTE